MDKVIRLEEWKTLLDSITTSDKNKTKSFRDLKDLFEHLSPQTAIRLQKDLRSCTLRSNQVFSDLFDTIDLSDKPLLCSYLRMLRSFGYFRLSQIVSDIESDSSYHQTIEKVKWYELTPLLPAAGTIGWKAIMNHGIVKEETELLQVCLQLLSQKLHFCSIIYFMEQYKESSAIVKRNGEKVAEKLYELIRDTANDEESMIGLDVSLFNLLLPFTDENQQAAIIEATVQDLFKPHMIQRPAENEGYLKIFELVSRCIMTRGNLQEILFSKLLEHLKCNIVRRKRRHSIESVQDNEKVTLESLISSINTGVKFQDLLKRCDGITLSSKSLQTGYLRYWIEVLSKIVAQKTISPDSAIKILQTSSVLLISSKEFIDQQLSQDLSTLMAKSVENTSQSVKLDSNDDLDDEEAIFDPDNPSTSGTSDVEPTITQSTAKPCWSGTITMPDIVKFSASAKPVSGVPDFMHEEIGQNLIVCGRIALDHIRSYLMKLGSTARRNISIIKLYPLAEEDKAHFNTFFDYLYSRKRCGVLQTNPQVLKDFYILPVHENSSIPEEDLEPTKDPAVDRRESNCLLGLLVRSKRPTSSTSNYTPTPIK